MEKNGIINLTINLSGLWKNEDEFVPFLKQLLSKEPYNVFLKRYKSDDLLIVGMLLKAKSLGKNISNEYDLIMNNFFSFSTIEILEIEPDIECERCSGESELDCSECNGRGYLDCYECDGSGEDTCNICWGDGSTEEDEDGDPIDCDECYGSGNVTCSECGGEGTENCSECGGTGKYDCPDCEHGYVAAEEKIEIAQFYFLSYDPKIKNLLETKDKLSPISDDLLDVIYKSETTFLVESEDGKIDFIEFNYVIPEVNSSFFGEIDYGKLDSRILYSYSKGVRFSIYNLVDFFD